MSTMKDQRTIKAEHRTAQAEHRKELKTNDLADFLGRTIEGARNPNRNWLIAAAVIVVVALAVWAWFMFAGGSSKNAALMAEVQGAADLAQLEQLAQKNQGTIAGRTANFEIARILYQEGIRDLPSTDMRPGAIVKLERARGIYEKLANEATDNPVLAQEALMWTARAEEALIGAVPPDKLEPAGSIEKAIGYYHRLAAMKPESFETKAAAERAKQLEEQRAQIEAFYSKLNQQAGKPKKATP